MRRAVLSSGETSIALRLRDTPTADALWSRLPIEAAARIWGDEVYFEAGGPRLAEEPEAKALMTLGEIAYWPDGDAVALGFGETPISAPGEIRLAAPCNVWADAEGDLRLLSAVRPGDRILLRRA
ncbi:MAG: cyclophilin-like fold protein [Pseudomonadota bacterium]